jgi:hypothetical protein
MAKRPLRSQLNQIRAWVREGRTDAWIAHQLELPAAELREFKRRHGLTADGGEADEDLRDEIEAEVEAATREAEEAEEEDADDDSRGADAEPVAERAADSPDEPPEGAAQPRRRRRRRRGGRGGRGRGAPKTIQATFDHGDSDGFGLWLDPAVQDEAVYSEHWAGHREVEVSIEPDRIVIRRVAAEAADSADAAEPSE